MQTIGHTQPYYDVPKTPKAYDGFSTQAGYRTSYASGVQKAKAHQSKHRFNGPEPVIFDEPESRDYRTASTVDSTSHAYQSGKPPAETYPKRKYITYSKKPTRGEFRTSKFEKKEWRTEQRPKHAQARYNDKPRGGKYYGKKLSYWGFEKTFDQNPRTFFEEINAEVAAERTPQPSSTFELYEDEEFVVTRYSASGSKDASFSDHSGRSVLNPEEL